MTTKKYTLSEVHEIINYAGLALTTLWKSKDLLVRASEDGNEFAEFKTEDDGLSYSFKLWGRKE